VSNPPKLASLAAQLVRTIGADGADPALVALVMRRVAAIYAASGVRGGSVFIEVIANAGEEALG
jgi:hypothetical protein